MSYFPSNGLNKLYDSSVAEGSVGLKIGKEMRRESQRFAQRLTIGVMFFCQHSGNHKLYYWMTGEERSWGYQWRMVQVSRHPGWVKKKSFEMTIGMKYYTVKFFFCMWKMTYCSGLVKVRYVNSAEFKAIKSRVWIFWSRMSVDKGKITWFYTWFEPQRTMCLRKDE